MAEAKKEVKAEVKKEAPKKEAPPAPKAEPKVNTGSAPGVTEYAAKNAKPGIITRYKNKWS